MQQLDNEFWRVVFLAWICFTLGALLFQRSSFRDPLLGKLLILISPILLTAFGVHSTRVAADLATLVDADQIIQVSVEHDSADLLVAAKD